MKGWSHVNKSLILLKRNGGITDAELTEIVRRELEYWNPYEEVGNEPVFGWEFFHADVQNIMESNEISEGEICELLQKILMERAA